MKLASRPEPGGEVTLVFDDDKFDFHLELYLKHEERLAVLSQLLSGGSPKDANKILNLLREDRSSKRRAA